LTHAIPAELLSKLPTVTELEDELASHLSISKEDEIKE
jgi:hypothetical protein